MPVQLQQRDQERRAVQVTEPRAGARPAAVDRHAEQRDAETRAAGQMPKRGKASTPHQPAGDCQQGGPSLRAEGFAAAGAPDQYRCTPWRGPGCSQPVSTPVSCSGTPRDTVARHAGRTAPLRSGSVPASAVAPPHRERGRRTDAEPVRRAVHRSSPLRPRASRPGCAPRMRPSRADRATGSRRVHGRPDGSPGTQLGHRRVGAEGQRHAGRGELGEPVQLRRALRAEPARRTCRRRRPRARRRPAASRR